MSKKNLPQTAGFTEHGLLADICRQSFYEFVKSFWPVVSEEKPVWNWHIKYLCQEIQYCSERVFAGLPKEHDLLINVPPGTTKSTLLSVMHTPWAWARMPSAKSICFSHTQELVLDLARKTRDLIYSELYQKCFPEIKLRDDQLKMGYFGNDSGGWRLSVTVGGKSPTGFHAHFLMGDDPIDPKKALSTAELETANKFHTNTLPSRKVDKDISVTMEVMQRLAQNDPAGSWLRRAKESNGKIKVKWVCLPAEDVARIHPPRLAKYYKKVKGYPNRLLDVQRLGPKAIYEAKAQGQYSYAGQYLQDPVPPGGLLFDVEKFKIVDAPGEWFGTQKFFKRIVRAWDKAGTVNDGAFTVGVKMGIDQNGYIWVLHVKRGQWASHVREQHIKNTADLDGAGVTVVIEQEPGSGGKESAESTIRNLLGYMVVRDIPRGDKETRADAYSVAVNEGMVYLVKGPWNDPFIEEHRYFPRSEYKDQVDASSMAFSNLVKPVMRCGAMR